MTKTCFLDAELKTAEAKVEYIKSKIKEETSGDSQVASSLVEAKIYLQGEEYNHCIAKVQYNNPNDYSRTNAILVDLKNSSYQCIQECLDNFGLQIYNIYEPPKSGDMTPAPEATYTRLVIELKDK